MEIPTETEQVHDADLEISDPAFFRDLMKTLKIIGDGDLVDFTLNPEGITVKQMDPSHLFAVDLFIPRTFFDTYRVYEERKIALDVVNLIRLVFKRGKMKDHYLKAKIQGDRVIFDMMFKGTQTTRKTIAVRDPHEDRLLPAPIIVYNSRVRIITKTLKGILMDAKTIESEHILIQVDPEKLLFKVIDEAGYGLEHEFERYADEIFDLSSNDTQTAKFDIGYLLDLIKPLEKISETVELEISDAVPIRITAETPVYDLRLRYYLGPCVRYGDKDPEPVEDQELEEDLELEEAAADVDAADVVRFRVGPNHTAEVIIPQEDPEPVEIHAVEAVPDPHEEPDEEPFIPGFSLMRAVEDLGFFPYSGRDGDLFRKHGLAGWRISFNSLNVRIQQKQRLFANHEDWVTIREFNGEDEIIADAVLAAVNELIEKGTLEEDPVEIPILYEDPAPVEIHAVEADSDPHEDQLSPGDLYLKYYAEALARHTAEAA